MPFMLQPLPYAKNALAPAISERTVEFHYEKHHRGYIDKLNKIMAGTPMAESPLEDVIAMSWGIPEATSMFDNAAQAWNHNFFWQSMSPQGGERAFDHVSRRIEANFGTYDKFEQAFVERSLARFGSGWVWLIEDGERLKIITTGDSVTPMVLGFYPLLTCDLWEHAYYLDYQNDREKFVRSFLAQLANWQFAAQRMAMVHTKPATISPVQASQSERKKSNEVHSSMGLRNSNSDRVVGLAIPTLTS